MEKNLMPMFRGKIKVLVSELKEADAAVLGASALGWEAKDSAAMAISPALTPAPTNSNAQA